MNNLFVVFFILNIINVIIQTVKSLATVKGSPMIAALANAIAFGLYTVVLVYMTCELPLAVKAITVAICNFIGVFTVKSFEKKSLKEKLWKIEATLPVKNKDYKKFLGFLRKEGISGNSYLLPDGKYLAVNIYCKNKEESKKVKNLLKKIPNCHYLALETREL